MTSEGQAVDTEAAEDSFLDTLKARPHCSPSPRAWYPRIKRADALDTLAFLDQEWEPHADRYEEELREYRLFSLLLSGGPIVAPGMFVLGVLSSLLPSSWEPGTPWVNGF